MLDVSMRFLLRPPYQALVPIGRPIANTQLYILIISPTRSTGVAGELHIGGDGLARGYLNRTELTAQYPQPFSNQPENVCTKLGLSFSLSTDATSSGRTDNQVKIRGFASSWARLRQR